MTDFDFEFINLPSGKNLTFIFNKEEDNESV